MNRRNRAKLIDIREERAYNVSDVELREVQDDDNELILTGYASTFQPYEMYGGPERGGWIEQLDRNAFDKTLRENPDLNLLINHGGMPLARTTSETLKLSVDDNGLKVEARLDRSDPDVQRLEPKMRRGDMDEMSFAFRVKAQKWSRAEGYEDLDDDQTHRMITEVSLHKGDVSVVNYGANPTTSVALRTIIDQVGSPEFRDEEGLIPQALEALKSVTKSAEEVNRASAVAGQTGALIAIDHFNSITTSDSTLPISGGLLSVPALDEEARTQVKALEERIAMLETAIATMTGQSTEEDRSEFIAELEKRIEEIEVLPVLTSDEEELSEEPEGMSLRAALLYEGVLPNEPLSLEEALAL